MKSTKHFKQTIKVFLDNKAANDELFAQSYNKPHKNLDNCVTYVLNWVRSTGCCGFSDDEIYGKCLDYYDEDYYIDIGKDIQCNVVVNHRRCVVIHDAPSFFSLTIKIGSFSLSCDILRISLVYVFATSK